MALVNTKEMFKKAYDGGYAIGAFNINDMEIIQGIMSACAELKAPVILQVSSSARKYAHPAYLVKMVEAAVKENPDIPVALHLDHGPSFEMCKACIDDGFTSVMYDGSAKPYEENVEEARRVVEYAHKYNVTVEAELGKLAGVEDDVKVEDDKAQFTDPDEVQDFVTRTGVDSLAIAIGTSHGAYKFKPGQKPKLRLDILEEVSNRLPGFPIVLHGASSVLPEFVQMVNQFGGQMPDAIGIPEEMLREAAARLSARSTWTRPPSCNDCDGSQSILQRIRPTLTPASIWALRVTQFRALWSIRLRRFSAARAKHNCNASQ